MKLKGTYPAALTYPQQPVMLRELMVALLRRGACIRRVAMIGNKLSRVHGHYAPVSAFYDVIRQGDMDWLSMERGFKKLVPRTPRVPHVSQIDLTPIFERLNCLLT